MTEQTSGIKTEDIFEGIYLLSNDLSDVRGFTLTSVGHNEMFFLPSFLAHYRALGVERFVFIDDKSDDGAREFLAQQPDVMVLGSKHNFGDNIIPTKAQQDANIKDTRVSTVWRKYLLDKFCAGQWSLHVDMDEYIHLPEGMTFPRFTQGLDPVDGEVVISVMLEAVPASITDMVDAQHDKELDLSKDWYFEGRPHIKITPEGRSVRIYGGLMSRILTQYGLIKPDTWKRKMKWWLRQEPGMFNALQKPSLLYWDPTDIFLSSHGTDKPIRHDTLLPLLHFKFNGALYKKVAFAIESQSYFRGSRKYVMLEELLAKMVRKKGSFIGRSSIKFTGFDDFARTGNAQGLAPNPPV